jgi:hypothetical protein
VQHPVGRPSAPHLIVILLDRGQAEVAVDPSGVELFAEGVRASLLANRAPRAGGPGVRGDRPGLPPSDRATWAGSPAASSPTAPRPNAPSSSPNSSAPPGRRCGKPSPATASACPLATPPPSASAPSPPSASAAASRPPRPWTRCSWPSIPVPSRAEPGRRPSCSSGSAARSRTPSWAPTWWSSCIARVTPASPPPGLGDHPTGRPQPPAGRPTRQPLQPSRPHQPLPPTPGAGDGGRCPLTPPAPPASSERFHTRCLP